jgi:hypothetical protein
MNLMADLGPDEREMGNGDTLSSGHAKNGRPCGAFDRHE